MKKSRSRAAMLALSAAIALGACTKAPTTVNDATGQTNPERSSTSEPKPSTSDVSKDTGSPTPSPQSVNVQSKVDKLAVKAEPAVGSKTLVTLDKTTKLGSRTTLLVVEANKDWLKVSLPTRPNGSSGWVEAKNVDLRSNDYQITVDLASKRAVVSKAGQAVLETPVAIGTDQNKTPKGTFFITDLVQTDDAKGAYGPFALGISAHSDTLTEFGGGDGQVALHGTNDPSSIGKPVSHGCVRLPNDAITKLAKMTPLGTPVLIA